MSHGLNWSGGGGRVAIVEYVDRVPGHVERFLAAAVVVAAARSTPPRSAAAIDAPPTFRRVSGTRAGLVGRYLHDHPREWWPASRPAPLAALSHPVYVARARHDDSRAADRHFAHARACRPRRSGCGRTTEVDVAARSGCRSSARWFRPPDLGVSLATAIDATMASCRPMISPALRRRGGRPTSSRRVHAPARLFADAGVRAHVPGPFHDCGRVRRCTSAASVRMHADPEFGVLDGWNRMHDVPNVVVCDSSCFTTGPEKNPTLTAMAIAARAADRLADRPGRTTQEGPRTPAIVRTTFTTTSSPCCRTAIGRSGTPSR